MFKISKISIGILLAISVHVSAVEVNVKEAVFIGNKDKKDAFKEYLKSSGNFTANDDNDLYKNLEDDAILANYFIRNGISSMEQAKLENMVNRYFAEAQIKKVQNEIILDDKIIKSYYLDNLETFKIKPVADMTIVQFKTLEDASEFFFDTKDKNLKDVINDANEKAEKLTEYKHPVNRMYPGYRDSLKDYNQSNYLTPPQYIRGKFVVLYIRDIEVKNTYYSLEEVKSHIIKTLHQKTYIRERKKLIDNYREEQ